MPINPFDYDRADDTGDDTGDDTEGHIIREHDPAGADDTQGHRRRESPRPEIFDLDR